MPNVFTLLLYSYDAHFGHINMFLSEKKEKLYFPFGSVIYDAIKQSFSKA